MTAAPEVDPDLIALFDDLLENADATPTRQLELDAALWTVLEEAGVTRLTDPDIGASWRDSAALLLAAARRGARVPVAENDLLGRWLADAAGLDVPDGILTVAQFSHDGTASAVPWASFAAHLVGAIETADGWRAAVIAAGDATIVPGWDLAGQPRDDVTVDVSQFDGVPIDREVMNLLKLRGALARSVQTVGALEGAVASGVAHAVSRTQFGRPIAKFQAVQDLLADSAGELAIARIAADRAVVAISDPDVDPARLELLVAVARSVTGHATSVIVRNIHQVHGAMGTTFEHRLHDLTGPAMAWRGEFGSIRDWDALIATGIRASGLPLWRAGVPA